MCSVSFPLGAMGWSVIVALPGHIHMLFINLILFFLFDFILYVPSTILKLCGDRSSWVEPVLS